MIKYIVLDYAGVLTPTQDNYSFAQKYHKKYAMELMEFFELTYFNWEKARVGAISSEEFWIGIAEKLNTDPITFRDSLIETFPVNTQLLDILRSYKKQGVKIGMISNQVEDWIQEYLRISSSSDVFDITCNSYEAGVAKPDLNIFKEFCLKAGVNPDECIFTDDQDKNCKAATKLGFHSFVYQDNESFKETVNLIGNFSK